MKTVLENYCAGEAHAPEDDSATFAQGSVETFPALPFDVGMPAETAHTAQAAPDVFEAHQDVLLGDGARVGARVCRQSLADLSFELEDGLITDQFVGAKEKATDGSGSTLGDELRKQSPAR